MISEYVVKGTPVFREATIEGGGTANSFKSPVRGGAFRAGRIMCAAQFLESDKEEKRQIPDTCLCAKNACDI